MVIITWSYHNMHIPILLFDEERFKKRIRFLAIFWKKNLPASEDVLFDYFEKVKDRHFFSKYS